MPGISQLKIPIPHNSISQVADMKTEIKNRNNTDEACNPSQQVPINAYDQQSDSGDDIMLEFDERKD